MRACGPQRRRRPAAGGRRRRRRQGCRDRTQMSNKDGKKFRCWPRNSPSLPPSLPRISLSLIVLYLLSLSLFSISSLSYQASARHPRLQRSARHARVADHRSRVPHSLTHTHTHTRAHVPVCSAPTAQEGGEGRGGEGRGEEGKWGEMKDIGGRERYGEGETERRGTERREVGGEHTQTHTNTHTLTHTQRLALQDPQPQVGARRSGRRRPPRRPLSHRPRAVPPAGPTVRGPRLWGRAMCLWRGARALMAGKVCTTRQLPCFFSFYHCFGAAGS